MVAASMTVRAQRYGVGFKIRPVIRQMLNVVNLKVRFSIHFKWTWLSTSLTDTLGVEQNPIFDFGYAGVGFGCPDDLLRYLHTLWLTYEITLFRSLYISK
ncbi:hypothetical protein A8L59_19720 [Pseudomonas koreensis]|uniref:Uncharacterized protein n=1 Tax=Pseudomonas koreensis TaxID=198620 RepID=A0AAC9BXG6_9PSED|nr:hypothetical protein A8L59_19720 [Pseudomonas koreensis]